ncbi:hypothetical protein VPH35_009123 [Triticum aestivum]
MEYEPAVFCGRCGRKAPRWISWSVLRYALFLSVLCPPMLCSISLSYELLYFELHGFIQWHDDPTSPFLRVLLGDLRDRVWKLEDDVAALCTDGDAGAGALRVEMQKRTEQTARDGGAGASIRDNLVRKGLMLVCGFLIFVSGLVLGMILS